MKATSPRFLAAAAIVCVGAFHIPAAYAQGTFLPGYGTTANCNIGATGASADSKTCTVGAAPISVAMTAWGFTNASLGSTELAGFRQGRLADWSTSGIGALTGNKESTSGGNHGFDNYTSGCGSSSSANGGTVTLSGANSGCGGSIEALFLDFGTDKVNLTDVGIGWNGGNADLSVWMWTGSGGPNMATQTAKGSTTTTGTTSAAMAGWSLVSNHDFGSGTGYQSTGGSLFSSYFLVTTYFGAATSTLTAGNDAFKINKFTVATCSGTLNGGTNGNGASCGTTPPPPGVPEPGSMALAGLALIGVFASRRKVKALF